MEMTREQDKAAVRTIIGEWAGIHDDDVDAEGHRVLVENIAELIRTRLADERAIAEHNLADCHEAEKRVEELQQRLAACEAELSKRPTRQWEHSLQMTIRGLNDKLATAEARMDELQDCFDMMKYRALEAEARVRELERRVFPRSGIGEEIPC